MITIRRWNGRWIQSRRYTRIENSSVKGIGSIVQTCVVSGVLAVTKTEKRSDILGEWKDLTGETINNWDVISFVEINKFGQSVWRCKCGICNKTFKEQTMGYFNKYNGCKDCRKKLCEDLYGRIFNRWTVIGHTIRKEDGKTYSLCQCSCKDKTVRLVRNDRLKNGCSNSCGCYKKEVATTKFGLSRTRLSKILDGMKERCYNESNKRYMLYGGRGISICDEWMKDDGVLNFIDWAHNNGYEDGLTIERIDVNGNYEPSNCTWITMEEQAKNKTNTIYIEYKGNKVKLVDIASESGIDRATILNRYKSGYIDEDLTREGIIDNTSGTVGVSYSNSQNNWRAYINVDGKRIELGRRKNKDEAIKLRKEAEAKYYGQKLYNITLS